MHRLTFVWRLTVSLSGELRLSCTFGAATSG
jgi:hypothetical protein